VSCEWIRPKLDLLADNELSGDEARRVAWHLSACPQCRDLYDRLRSEARLLSRTLAVQTLSEAEVLSLERRVLQHVERPTRVRVVDHTSSFAIGLFLIGVVVVSYAVTSVLPTGAAAVYEEIARGVPTSSDLWAIAVNIAAALVTAAVVAVGRRISVAGVGPGKGGVVSWL
jgi:predicted anti-sigma-YlaC factor YlaD